MLHLLDGPGAQEDMARDLRRLGLELEVIPAASGSRCVGLSVAELEAAAAGAFLVVALSRSGGRSVLQPTGDMVIAEGDGVAVVGRPGRAQAVEALFTA